MILHDKEEQGGPIVEYTSSRVIPTNRIEQGLQRGQEPAHKHIQVVDLELGVLFVVIVLAGRHLHHTLQDLSDLFLALLDLRFH